MTYDVDYIQQSLDEYGEVIVTLESGQTLELHNHDTHVVSGDQPEVIVDLADGTFAFEPGRVESIAYHKQTTEDVGL